jgi:hypothetical protein
VAQLDGCGRENMLYTEQKQVFVLLMFHFLSFKYKAYAPGNPVPAFC